TRSGSTIEAVVTSTLLSPRSSARAAATTWRRSGFDETIGLLAQAKSLLGESEEVGLLAADAALLSGGLNHAAVDAPAPEVAAIDRQPQHRLIHVLELRDGELR